MMFHVTAVVQHDSLGDVMRALRSVEDLSGVAISSHVTDSASQCQGPEASMVPGDPKWVRIDMLVSLELLDAVVETIEAFAHTGRRGGRSIIMIPVRQAMN